MYSKYHFGGVIVYFRLCMGCTVVQCFCTVSYVCAVTVSFSDTIDPSVTSNIGLTDRP